MTSHSDAGLRYCNFAILRILDDVAAHFVGFPLYPTLIVVDLRYRQFHGAVLVMVVAHGHLLLLLLLLLLQLLVVSLQSVHRIERGTGIVLRPRGPLVSVVPKLSWLLIVLLVDNVLEGEAQGAWITVKPQGVLQSLFL